MPVALTHHIDRSEGKNLLRGRVCLVHSLTCNGAGENDRVTHGSETIWKKTPKVVFLLFNEGEDEKGEQQSCK